VDNFISQFTRLNIVFKCYKVYLPNNKERVYHKIKSLTMIVSHSFQGIKNELETDLIFFFVNTKA
jgi:hypothetical protein